VAYLDELETQLEPYTEEQRVNHLLHGLRSDISDVIMERLEIPQTREALIALAIKIEETQEGKKSRTTGQRSDDTGESKATRRPSRFTNQRFRKNESISSGHKPGDQDKKKKDADNSPSGKKGIECFKCHKIGHIARDCTENPSPHKPDAKA
jgi:hypothetical protein